MDSRPTWSTARSPPTRRRRDAIADFERLRAEQKSLGKQIPQAQGEAKQELLARTKTLSAEVKEAEAAQGDGRGRPTRRSLRSIPNLGQPRRPAGGEDDYVVLEHVGTPRDFAAEGFEPRDHVELGRMLGAIDIERGAKVSGARFYYLTGPGADLEMALTQTWRWTRRAPPGSPPSSRRRWCARARWRAPASSARPPTTSTASTARTSTSSAPRRCRWRRTTPTRSSTARDLPLRYAAFSPCFRKEAGSYGKDTAGIIRVHWFDKVEMFTFTTLEESYAEHQRLLGLGEGVPRQARAGLPRHRRGRRRPRAVRGAQVRLRGVDPDPGPLPRAHLDVELHRLPGPPPRHPRPLRGRHRRRSPRSTARSCAMPRTIVAILETHQQADGSVRVPEALRPYLQGREVLEPVARRR